MAVRDLATTAEKLAAAQKIEGDDAFATELERLRLIHGYLEGFWRAVDTGGRKLQGADELLIGDVRTAVVEYDRGRLVLRVAGENRRYTMQTMPAKIAITLAEQAMPAADPQNKVYYGAFLLMDSRGGRGMGAEHWKAAAAANVDVSLLLPELETLPPSTLPIPLPEVTSLMRKTLAPEGWAVLRAAERGKPSRTPLENSGSQNEAGRLEVTLPEDAAAGQIVFSRPASGNFGCRAIFEHVAEGQAFGLFSSENGAPLCRVPLPAGAVMVALARVRGMWVGRANHKAAEVETGAGRAIASAELGITVPAGSSCTISWFERQSR